MDSLTHIVIGAAIGEAMLGRQIGRKAALIGALAKTIPDFDIFYTGLEDPLLYICHHRGHTHSLLWETLYALPLAYLFYRLFRREITFLKWTTLFLICLYGHSLLDLCTNYGTRLFLPITNRAFAWNNIAIADLFFTLPMLIMLIVALFFQRFHPIRIRLIRGLLLYCFIYLGYTFANKLYANNLFQNSLNIHQISYQKSMTNPTILSNFHWYGIATNDTALYVAETSLLFPHKNMNWMRYSRRQEILNAYPDSNLTHTLRWFSNGYDITDQLGDTTLFFSVKFGRTNRKMIDPKESFVFYYKLFYENGKSRLVLVEPNQRLDYKSAIGDLYHEIMGDED